jgi:ACS family pantothenate transporter-like MFS transporter
MNADKKAYVVDSVPASTSDLDVGVGEATPQKVSFGKKILYHLWDADQHLKSPQVRLSSQNFIFALELTEQERALVRKLDFGILICATLGWVRRISPSYCMS